jgi:hypothetical protein
VRVQDISGESLPDLMQSIEDPILGSFDIAPSRQKEIEFQTHRYLQPVQCVRAGAHA